MNMDRARDSLRRNSCVLRYMCLQRYLWEMNSALYAVASAELTIVFTYRSDSNSTKLAPIALYTHCSQLVSAPSGYATLLEKTRPLYFIACRFFAYAPKKNASLDRRNMAIR